MCDTIVAPPASTGQRVMLFGKNSDRQRNEAQAVELFPARNHEPGAQRLCTYISIPEVARTQAVMVCRPFWIWGAEMGANESGVVIGNEGLRARSGLPEQEALIGMDLLRLALERSATAAQAVETITTLLDRHGQGGNCGHLEPAYYHNGFMIADADEAFVVETVGREWLLERVQGLRAISNRYSIEARPERASAGLDDLTSAVGGAGLNYADALSDDSLLHIGNATGRRERGASLMMRRQGLLETADMMAVLRDHGADSSPPGAWRPECTTLRTLCLHAGGEDRQGQTVGSMVSELRKSGAIHWTTGTAAPCLSIFKPVLVDVPLPSTGPELTDAFDVRTLWWRHERLHRAAMLSEPGPVIEAIRPEREALEAGFRERMRAVMDGGTIADKSHVIAKCWADAAATEDDWYARLAHRIARKEAVYQSAWLRLNDLAGIDPFLAHPQEQSPH